MTDAPYPHGPESGPWRLALKGRRGKDGGQVPLGLRFRRLQPSPTTDGRERELRSQSLKLEALSLKIPPPRKHATGIEPVTSSLPRMCSTD
jgi:hypothetical protein